MKGAPNWRHDPDLLARLRALYERGAPYREMYDAIRAAGYTPATFAATRVAFHELAVQRGWRRDQRGAPTAQITPEERLLAEEERARQRAERQALQELRSDEVRFRRLLAAIELVTQTLPPPDVPDPPPARVLAGTGPERAIVLVISDVQAGLVVHADEVGERLAYSSATLEERWQRYETNVCAFIDEQVAIGPVIAIALVVPGDLVENHQLREGARKRTDLDLTAATFTVERLFAHLVRLLRTRYGVPVSVDIVPGNHDRIGGMRPGTEKTTENWAVIIGWALAKEVRADPGVEVHTHLAEYALLQIGRSRMFVHHGHGIRGTALLPWYGIDRRVTRWEGWARHTFDYVVLGHYHNFAAWQTASGCTVYVNGAWFQSTAYGTSLGLANDAQQLAFALTEREGIVYTRQIVLADRLGPEPAEPRIWKEARP